MQLKFSKMHGLGNDFVVLNGITQSIDPIVEQLRHLADRQRGIGCDQILLVEPPTQSVWIFVIAYLIPTAARSNNVAMVRAALCVLFANKA